MNLKENYIESIVDLAEFANLETGGSMMSVFDPEQSWWVWKMHQKLVDEYRPLLHSLPYTDEVHQIKSDVLASVRRDNWRRAG